MCNFRKFLALSFVLLLPTSCVPAETIETGFPDSFFSTKKALESALFVIIIFEKIKSNDKVYRKEKEKQFINKFNTYFDGINDMP